MTEIFRNHLDTPCPNCGHVHSDPYGQAFGRPNDGLVRSVPGNATLTICANCAELLMFNDLGMLVKVPEEVWNRLRPEAKDAMVKLREAMLLIKKYGFDITHRKA